MKKITFFILFAFSFMTAQAQVKFGIKGGINTNNINGSINLKSKTDSFRLAIIDAKYGYNLGVFIKAELGPIFVRPELMLNSNKVTYSLKNLAKVNTDTLRSETYTTLDIPLIFGTKLGPLKLVLGPVAHIHLNSNSELKTVDGWKDNFATAKWGAQIGILANLGEHVSLDFKYEGNFFKFGDNITYDGKSYSFAKTPKRFLVGVGYTF